uniref:Uncharacterized protein n=1 Tax=Aggregatibacter actinomycetemcomitans TaxID=714 RepID=S4WBA3_AGGAC|nr:hypothetical protein [Aggregatibacter actinomycetemcomitans]AGO88737.1 hypothetical protein pS23A_0002 [Aggregatibacter actinomycetemcomitans]
MFNKLSHKLHYTLIPALFMMATNPAFAGGLQKTKQYLSQFSTEIHSFAGIVFVLAGFICGLSNDVERATFRKYSKSDLWCNYINCCS